MKLSKKLNEHIESCKACSLAMKHTGLVAMECDKGNDLAISNDDHITAEAKGNQG